MCLYVTWMQNAYAAALLWFDEHYLTVLAEIA